MAERDNKNKLWYVYKITELGVIDIFQSLSLSDVRSSIRGKRVRKDRLPKKIRQKIELFDVNNQEAKEIKQIYNLMQIF